MLAACTRRVRVDGPVDLGLTFGPLVRGAYDPTSCFDAGAWWRAWNTPAGAVTTCCTLDADAGELEVRAWGTGREWMLDRAAEWFDTTPFAPRDPVVASLARRTRGLRVVRIGTAYDMTLATIIEQRVTSIESRRTWARFVRNYGEAAPGPRRLRVAPSAVTVAALSDHERHALGLELHRGRTLSLFANEATSVERAVGEGAGALSRRLRAVPGIGPWTAATVVHFAAGDADAVPVGDYHFPSHVAWVLAGERRADDARMLELLEPYRPTRGVVLRHVLAGASGPPRRVPKARIQDQLRRERMRPNRRASSR